MRTEISCRTKGHKLSMNTNCESMAYRSLSLYGVSLKIFPLLDSLKGQELIFTPLTKNISPGSCLGAAETARHGARHCVMYSVLLSLHCKLIAKFY